MERDPEKERNQAVKDQGRSFLDAMFTGGLPHAEDKDMDRAVRARGMQAADLWTLMVAWIADPVRTPSPRINALGLLGWKLCGSNTASLSMTTMVRTPTFLVASKPPRMVGVIMVPPNFVELATADPVMQLGAAVFVNSQVRDYWNSLVFEREKIVARAKAHEAEYLRLVRDQSEQISNGRGWTPNEYQREVMEEYPSFPPELEYESLPFSLARARELFASASPVGLREPDDPPRVIVAFGGMS